MDGRTFLDAARHLLAADTEPTRRAMAAPLYYAALHEARVALDRWGFVPAPGEDLDKFVLERFDCGPHYDLIRVVDVLERLDHFYEEAFQQVSSVGTFADNQRATHMLYLAEVGIDLLDQIEADPARRAAAVAAIRAAFP
jgi:hypothetical protein